VIFDVVNENGELYFGIAFTVPINDVTIPEASVVVQAIPEPVEERSLPGKPGPKDVSYKAPLILTLLNVENPETIS